MVTAGALIVCLVGTPWSATLVASEEGPSSNAATSRQSVVDSTSEVRGQNPASSAAVLSASERPASQTELPGPAVERSPFSLNDEILAANALVATADAQRWPSALTFASVGSSSLAQRVGYGGRRRAGRHGALAAILIGTAVAVAGGAIMANANRPACRATNHAASGCGNIEKATGGVLLTAGVVVLAIGVLSLR
jgi:hypothetical protein